MEFKEIILRDAQAEQEKNTLIDDYGNLVWWLGYPVNFALAIIGGGFDAAVLYSIIFSGSGNKTAAILIGLSGAVIIQLLMGAPLMKSAKRLYRGDFNKKGYGKMLFFGILIFLVGLSFTLYLSWKTDKLAAVALEDDFEKLYRSEDDVLDYFSNEKYLIDSTFNADMDRVDLAVKDIKNDRSMKVRESGTWVLTTKAKNAISKMQSTDKANILSIRDLAKVNMNKKEDTELLVVRTHNQRIDSRKQNQITQSGLVYRGANVAINIFRSLILIGFICFILDAAKELTPENKPPSPTPSPNDDTNTTEGNITVYGEDMDAEKLKEQLLKNAEKYRNGAAARHYGGIDSEQAHGTNSTGNSEQNLTERAEQPETLVDQEAQPEAEQRNKPTEQTHGTNGMIGFRQNGTNKMEQTPPIKVVEQTTVVVNNNFDLRHLKRRGKQTYLRSFFPSTDTYYQKQEKAGKQPSVDALDNNKMLHANFVSDLKEAGYYPHYSGEGKFRAVEFIHQS